MKASPENPDEDAEQLKIEATARHAGVFLFRETFIRFI